MEAETHRNPIAVAYFYKVRWGFHDEWLELFRRNHWPLLREGLRSGRYVDVRLAQPRFHGDGRGDWDVLVTITYRDWTAVEAHSEADLIASLFPDQETFRREEQ